MIEGIERRVTDVELPGLVVPGLVDLQVNGWGTRDVREGTVEAVEAIATGLLSHGVTAWLPTIVSCSPAVRLAAIDAVAAARRRQLAGETIGARVLGVHLEGPWIAARRRGAHQLEYLEPPNELSIAQSLTRVPGLVRIVTIAPELDGGLDAIRQVVGAGAVASIGHTDASFLETVDAVNAGARMATHLYNAMRPMHHREPGVVGAVLTDPRVVAGLISDGVHVDPSVVSLVFRAKPERVALVSDVVAGEGSDAARLADGTLAGAYASLSDGVAVAARAGVMLGFAVEAATLTPAETIGARLGRLTPGAFADFVVLDDDLRCVATYLGGERVWSADD
ncbi:MAG TPA: amidohydrolase family protein [Actinomycetota bacterium]|jgi:N-acetylglucosamine-6-phosphate deacetylase|nr:amidohydrolase family protein [Actinomycetota bacterium]